MGRPISRRDFIHDLSLVSLGLALPELALAGGAETAPGSYPPTRTGLRGSHPGSYEVAHRLVAGTLPSAAPVARDERYDLVVVGGGISGLATAWYYRKRFGPGARILILENHDDFGGHAKRNEFHQGGEMRLAWGGVFNLEFPMFSDTVKALLAELGVDLHRLLERYDFNYGADGPHDPATWFDAETYGRDALVTGFSLRHGNLEACAARVDELPLDAASRESLRRFFTTRRDVLAGRTPAERQAFLRDTGYLEFLTRHAGLTAEAAALFVKTTHGYMGIGADSMSVRECLGAGLPARHLLGEEGPSDGDVGGEVAMFPDGNASIARLLVRGLIPGVAAGQGMDDIVSARFDYARLDEPSSAVRLRLNSTVTRVEEPAGDAGVAVTYVRGDAAEQVTARHCVLACYHCIIPYLCPQLPAAQKEALGYQVKRPLLLTNVLLRDSAAADRLGITGAYCPGRLHGATWLVKGIGTHDYPAPRDAAGPVVMQFWGSVAPPESGLNPQQQYRASQQRLLDMDFHEFEREVRTVLNGMLGPAGFDAARDVLAITVNRWPHGYAHDYLDLWDPQWPPGDAPHEIARRRFGNVAIANADAGANAYTHVAIDQAWRAVGDLPAA